MHKSPAKILLFPDIRKFLCFLRKYFMSCMHISEAITPKAALSPLSPPFQHQKPHLSLFNSNAAFLFFKKSLERALS